MTETYLPLDKMMAYYGENFTAHAGDISHMPLNYNFTKSLKSPADVTVAKVRLLNE